MNQFRSLLPQGFLLTMGVWSACGSIAMAQAPITPGVTPVFHSNNHVGFDSPEGWGLKYFASTSLLSGLPLAEPPEGWKPGSVTLGLELGQVPHLDAGQRRIGFGGTSPEDLNKTPIFARVVVRVHLTRKLTLIAAAPPPFELRGVRTRLLAFGLERPIFTRNNWTVGWRGYGQVGSAKGAFTCSRDILAFAPGSPANPTACIAESSDVASLRYAGSEFQVSRRLESAPKLTLHAAAGGNFIDGVFQVHAPVLGGLDETRLWTRGGTFSTSGGVSYQATARAAIAVDLFYSPLWVKRTATAPRTNDGLLNPRVSLTYSLGRN